MKGFPLLRDEEPINPPIPDLVNLPAEGMANLFLKEGVNPDGGFHRFPVLWDVFDPFPADDRTHCHDGAGEGTAGFSLSRDPAGQRTSRFKNLFASNIQLFLQGCKNGLRSPKVVHVILERQLRYFLKELFTISHKIPPRERYCVSFITNLF